MFHARGAARAIEGRREAGEGQILTEAAEIAALLRAAESIAYTEGGTSGATYLRVMTRLGLSEAVAPKGRPMDGGRPVAAVATGEAELAVGPLTTILSSPGVAVAAIFPEAVGASIDISVVLSPLRAAGAAEVLDALTNPGLDAELAAAGLGRYHWSS